MSHSFRVALREVNDADLPIFFAHQRDPESTRMAAFPAREHDAFFAHWAKIRRDPANIIRTIVFEGDVAGYIGSWPAGDKRLLAYWIGREFWGRGIATAALAAFVLEVTHRPLHAFVVRHNVGSIRVLQKCRFIQQDSAPTVGEDGVEELLFALPQ
jgi:RimJ/RimL family protein N-acetyltransferase